MIEHVVMTDSDMDNFVKEANNRLVNTIIHFASFLVASGTTLYFVFTHKDETLVFISVIMTLISGLITAIKAKINQNKILDIKLELLKERKALKNRLKMLDEILK